MKAARVPIVCTIPVFHTTTRHWQMHATLRNQVAAIDCAGIIVLTGSQRISAIVEISNPLTQAKRHIAEPECRADAIITIGVLVAAYLALRQRYRDRWLATILDQVTVVAGAGVPILTFKIAHATTGHKIRAMTAFMTDAAIEIAGIAVVAGLLLRTASIEPDGLQAAPQQQVALIHGAGVEIVATRVGRAAPWLWGLRAL